MAETVLSRPGQRERIAEQSWRVVDWTTAFPAEKKSGCWGNTDRRAMGVVRIDSHALWGAGSVLRMVGRPVQPAVKGGSDSQVCRWTNRASAGVANNSLGTDHHGWRNLVPQSVLPVTSQSPRSVPDIGPGSGLVTMHEQWRPRWLLW